MADNKKRKVPEELAGSVYSFLVKGGLASTAKAYLKESGLSEKTLKSASDIDLLEVVAAARPTKRAPEAAAANASKKTKKSESDEEDSDSDSDSDSSEDEKPVAKKAAAAPAPAPAPASAKKVAAKKEDTSSSSSESESDSDSSEDEKPVAKKAVAAPAPAPASAKKVAAKKEDTSSSSSESESDSDSSEDEKPVAKKAAATPSTKASSAPASAPETPSGELFKVYVKGLPWKATEQELAEFFKGCGKPVTCEIPLGDDGRSTGTGYLRFTKRSELEAALELDGQYWPGTERWLKIVEGIEKPERKTFGTGVRPEGCDTVFVGNLPWDVDEDQMRELFGSCGEVARVRFATAEDGSFKGFGHVQFADGDSTDAAVALAGTDLNGRAIRVDYAPPRNRESLGGGAGRGDSGRGGGGRGGRGGGRDAGGRGGRGGRSPAVNKGKGTIVAAAGKKTSFGDDE